MKTQGSRKEKKLGLLKTTTTTRLWVFLFVASSGEKFSFRPVKFEMSFENSNRDIQESRFEFQGQSSD